MDASPSTAAPPAISPADRLRLHQSNERTMLAWVRTAVALMGFGFLVARFAVFLRELVAVRGQRVTGPGSTFWAGVALAVAGVAVLLAAMRRYGTVRHAIEHGTACDSSPGFMYLVASTIAIAGLAVVGLLIRSV